VKSVDGGLTWSKLPVNPSVDVIEFAPTRPQTIYAAGRGIWKARTAAPPGAV
jgi:hypothetical protein